MNLINNIQGRQIELLHLNLKVVNEKLDMIIMLQFDSERYNLLFENVSMLSVDDFSYPLIIQGIRIVDNKQKGWEKELRYEIIDFEDSTIHFLCERISEIDYPFV